MLWGCRPGLVFPAIKLLDYRSQWSSLEGSRNPFATVVMTHLAAHETRHDPAARQTRKLWLTRRLYKLGYDRQQVLAGTPSAMAAGLAGGQFVNSRGLRIIALSFLVYRPGPIDAHFGSLAGG